MSDETSTPPDSTPRESQAEQLRSSALIPAAHAPPLPPPSAPAASPTPPPAKAVPKAMTRPPTSPDLSVVPRPHAPRNLHASVGPMAPKPPSSNDVLRGTDAPAVQPVLTKELQEQLFGVIRASLDATLGPLHDRQRALEARLEALKAAPPMARPATTEPFAPSAPPARAPQPSLGVDVTPSVSVPPPAMAASPSLKPSVTSTSYGLVIDSGSRRPPPPIERALANVGPIDMPDFGGSRRRVGRILVGLLLAVVVAAIIATILSYN